MSNFGTVPVSAEKVYGMTSKAPNVDGSNSAIDGVSLKTNLSTQLDLSARAILQRAGIFNANDINTAYTLEDKDKFISITKLEFISQENGNGDVIIVSGKNNSGIIVEIWFDLVYKLKNSAEPAYFFSGHDSSDIESTRIVFREVR